MSKSNEIEEAQWWVAQRLRDINACENYLMMPIYRNWLAQAQQHLANLQAAA